MGNFEYLTKEKYNDLQAELEALKTTKRKEVAENLEYAKGLGDLSENAEYHEAREMQANLEDRIAKLENVLKSAVVVTDKHGSTINIGSEVKVKKNGDKTENVYTIVGSEEADVAHGKISINSLLGQALVGKKKGDIVTYDAPSGQIGYTVLEVK